MLNTELKLLLDLYSATVFLCPTPIHFSDFAIITANNPNGKILEPKENEELNKLLKQQISQLDSIELIGASPDFTHQEPSFAINITQGEAVRLAKQFNQNAIFWVISGEVFLVSAGLYFQVREMGSFSNRCRKFPD